MAAGTITYGVVPNHDILGATQTTTFNTGETENLGITFNDDGTEMFVIGQDLDFFRYTLTTAYDISTASLSETVFLSDADNDIVFGNSGNNMYSIDGVGNVKQYSLLAPYDIFLNNLGFF